MAKFSLMLVHNERETVCKLFPVSVHDQSIRTMTEEYDEAEWNRARLQELFKQNRYYIKEVQ